MIDKLSEYKTDIVPFEEELIDEAISDHDLTGTANLTTLLTEFVQAGKHVRSGMYLCATSWWNDVADVDRRLAASIELIHSAMLIQDDVMDDDSRRRGQASIHARFESMHEDRRVAEGVAVCCSDLLIFAAMKGFGAADGVTSIVGKELQHVALGQLRDITCDDVWNNGDEPGKDDILSLYRSKTGRYTFTLPLRLAAERAGSDVERLAELGETLGVLFQLRDDELNVYGSEATTGKPVLSDVEEGKQTMLRLLVVEEHPSAEAYFGEPLTEEDKRTIQEMFADVKEEHKRIRDGYKDRAGQLIDEASLPTKAKQELHEMTSFVATRQR